LIGKAEEISRYDQYQTARKVGSQAETKFKQHQTRADSIQIGEKGQVASGS